MKTDFAEAMVHSVRHYLGQTSHILKLVSQADDPQKLLQTRLAPDMFDTGFNFAIAIQFAARALYPPAGREVPEIPEEFTCESLLSFEHEISAAIEPISAGDLWHPISHIAGKGQLQQDPADYIARFALPNMIFHLSLGYAGLRHGGLEIGKTDFDGLHVY